MDFFKSTSKNKIGQTTFLVFEILALVVFIIYTIINIYNAAITQSFAVFVSGLLNSLIYTSIVFGMGRIIDLLSNNVQIEKIKKDD